MKLSFRIPLVFMFLASVIVAESQELNARVIINTSKVGVTDKAVFDDLQEKLEQFINDRQWTDLQFQKNERIVCNFNITVNSYDKTSNLFECSALIQANRPVYNSQYNSTLYNNNDDDFNFEYEEYDQLNYRDESVDNQLMALIAYYAYLIIGLNLDSFSLYGGTDILQKCMTLVYNAQNFSYSGWKSFDSDRNRFAIINDYLEQSMKPFRQLQYEYYRKGMDEMVNNVERGRINISTCLQECLKKAHKDRPLSLLPQIWTDYKKEELASIYKGKGTQKEKENIYDLLMEINASQNTYWEKIKQ